MAMTEALQYGALGLLAVVLVAIGAYLRSKLASDSETTKLVYGLLQSSIEEKESRIDKHDKSYEFIQSLAERAMADREAQASAWKEMTEMILSVQQESNLALKENTSALRHLCDALDKHEAAGKERYENLAKLTRT